MNSMTGFGRAEICRRDYKLQVEITSVNSRFLECTVRMPRLLAAVESKIREIIGQGLNRGKVTLTVNLEETGNTGLGRSLNAEQAMFHYKSLLQIKKRLHLPGEIDLGHILAYSQTLSGMETALSESKLWPDLKKLILKALSDLKRMRLTEGQNLKKDMNQRLKTIGKLVALIEKQLPLDISAYKQKLEKRLQELGNGLQLDPHRLAEELTIYADRSDISEECTRLRSHLGMFAETIKNDGEAGKKLNFVLQEMGREANTIGSKALSKNISTLAIEIKEEIEKLREQAQNIE